MIPNVRFEADFLRAALLLGLVREDDVRNWADALLAVGIGPIEVVADVALARLELTTLREALRPLADPSDAALLGPALLTFAAVAPSALTLPLADRIRVLGQLRREEVLDAAISARIKSFEDRLMLASAGVGTDPSLAVEFEQWLAAARRAAYYRISLEHADERAALLGALSRKIVRDRRVHAVSGIGSRAWMVSSVSSEGPTLVLNEPLWHIALAEFSPLPIGSRIPYATIPANAVLVLDEATAEPMGADEARDRLSTV